MRERPNLTPEKAAEHVARDARLATALRENLRRRKEQARVQKARGDMPGGLSGTVLSSKSGVAGGDTAD
jgi:hypothetical protein